MLLIGSPMCRVYSSLQEMNKSKKDPEVRKRELVKARVHLAFCAQLYRDQLKSGRYLPKQRAVVELTRDEELG